MELIKASLMAAAMQGGGGGGGSSQDWQDLLGMLHDLFTIPINSKYHFVYQVAMGKDPRFFGVYHDPSTNMFSTTPVYTGDGESTNTRVGTELCQYPEANMRSGVFEFITLYENDAPILTWWTNGRAYNLDRFSTYAYYAGNYEDNSYWWEGQRVTEAEYKAQYYSTSPHSTARAAAYKTEEYSNYRWSGGSGAFSRFNWDENAQYYYAGIYIAARASWGYGYTYDYTTRSANIDYTDPATGCGTTPESVIITTNTVTQGASVGQTDQSFSLIPAKSYDYLIYTNKTFAQLNAAYDEIIKEIAQASITQMSGTVLYRKLPYRT